MKVATTEIFRNNIGGSHISAVRERSSLNDKEDNSYGDDHGGDDSPEALMDNLDAAVHAKNSLTF